MIRTYIHRYLEGESSQEELRQLREYFRSTPEVPADLLPFARMFALLEERQPTPSAEALDRLVPPSNPLQTLSNSPLKGEDSHPFKGGWGRVFLAAACLAAVAFILLAPPRQREENMAVAYVDGKMLTDESQVMQMGQEALAEIFSAGVDQEQQLNQIFNAP